MSSDATNKNNLSERVLGTFREHDEGARIVSVLRDECGRSVVRVRSSKDHNAIALSEVMKSEMPLAQSSVIENSLDGTIETEVVVPTRADERARAHLKAAGTTTATALMWAAQIMLWGGVAVWVASVWEQTTFDN